MANGLSNSTLRCRRCRGVLLTRNINPEADDECCKTFVQLQPIMDEQNSDDSQMPEWLLAALNEHDWRKGKLCCPDCHGKVGSFNFVSSQKCSCGRQQTPSVYLYKSRIDICPPSNSFVLQDQKKMKGPSRTRDHFAVLKKSDSDEEWTVVFGSKPADSMADAATALPSKSANVKAHRKSKSWHGSTVSNWLTSTLSDVTSHLDLAAAETKQALVGTLDLANSVVATPVSSAIKKGHRKTKSWSGSIKTTLSSLLGGIFSNSRDQSNPESARTHRQSLSSSGRQVDRPIVEARSIEEVVVEPLEDVLVTSPAPEPVFTPVRHSRTKKKKPSKASQEQNRPWKQFRTRSRSSSAVSIIPDYLLCSICLDIFCLPRYCLPCRHAFCEPCLKLLAHTTPLSGNRLRILCPLCRQLIRWTEPASDLLVTLAESEMYGRYKRRVLEYKRQLSVRILRLPGIYQLKLVRQIVSGLPEGIARYVEIFWVEYTPLVTLYSFCISLLCLLFFFTLFLPCVYLTSWICKFFDNFPSFDELGASLVYQEVLDFGALVISSGVLSLASIVVIVSIALYTLFVM